MSRFAIALVIAPVALASIAARSDVMVGDKPSTFEWSVSTGCAQCTLEGGGSVLGTETDAGPYLDPVLVGGSREVLGTAVGSLGPQKAAIGLHADAEVFGGGAVPPATSAVPPYVRASADGSNDPIVQSVPTSSSSRAALKWYFAIVPKDPDPLAARGIFIDIRFSMGAMASCTTVISCSAEAHTRFSAGAPAILQSPPIEELLDVNYTGPGDDSSASFPPTTRTLTTFASASPLYWNAIETEARALTTLSEGEALGEAFVDPAVGFTDPADAADFDILVSSGIDPTTVVPEPGAALLGLASVGSLLLRRRLRDPART